MRPRTAVVISALLLVVGGGILEAHAGSRHDHKIRMIYRVSAPRNISGGGVQFVTANCPAGTKVTGAGAKTPGIAYVNEVAIESGANSVTVFYINDGNASIIRAEAACIKRHTGSTRAKLSNSVSLKQERQQVLQRAREKRSELQAQLKG